MFLPTGCAPGATASDDGELLLLVPCTGRTPGGEIFDLPSTCVATGAGHTAPHSARVCGRALGGLAQRRIAGGVTARNWGGLKPAVAIGGGRRTIPGGIWPILIGYPADPAATHGSGEVVHGLANNRAGSSSVRPMLADELIPMPTETGSSTYALGSAPRTATLAELKLNSSDLQASACNAAVSDRSCITFWRHAVHRASRA